MIYKAFISVVRTDDAESACKQRKTVKKAPMFLWNIVLNVTLFVYNMTKHFHKLCSIQTTLSLVVGELRNNSETNSMTDMHSKLTKVKLQAKECNFDNTFRKLN